MTRSRAVVASYVGVLAYSSFIFLGAYFLLSVVTFVMAGMDSGRFGWSANVPLGVTFVGVTLMLLGQLLFALARRENEFFSSTAAIQKERGHRVCDTGPYRFVRHPGYLGMALSMSAFPMVMQSYWAFIPASLAVLLLIVRAGLEDRFLMAHLDGYPEYASATRWRIIPGIF